jgi:hypothetical protein
MNINNNILFNLNIEEPIKKKKNSNLSNFISKQNNLLEIPKIKSIENIKLNKFENNNFENNQISSPKKIQTTNESSFINRNNNEENNDNNDNNDINLINLENEIYKGSGFDKENKDDIINIDNITEFEHEILNEFCKEGIIIFNKDDNNNLIINEIDYEKILTKIYQLNIEINEMKNNKEINNYLNLNEENNINNIENKINELKLENENLINKKTNLLDKNNKILNRYKEDLSIINNMYNILNEN